MLTIFHLLPTNIIFVLSIRSVVIRMSHDTKSEEAEGPSSPDSSEQLSQNEDQSKSATPKKRSSKSSKPRLTAVQKNTNHKDAENKRRNAIRERFTELSELVPDAQGQERSEQVMLAKTKAYIHDSIKEIRKLENLAAQQGIMLDDKGRLRDSDYGGSAWVQPNLEKYEKAKLKKSMRGHAALDDGDDGEAEDDVWCSFHRDMVEELATRYKPKLHHFISLIQVFLFVRCDSARASKDLTQFVGASVSVVLW